MSHPTADWRHSLRFKLLFIAIIVQLVMLVLLLGNSFRLLNGALETQTQARLEALTPLLNASLAGRMFQRDQAEMESILNDLVRQQDADLAYIILLDEQRRVVAAAPEEVTTALSPVDPPTLNPIRGKVLSREIPLSVAGMEVGAAWIGLSLHTMIQTRNQLIWQGLAIATGVMLLSLLLLLAIGHLITHHIATLLTATRRVAEGDFRSRIALRKRDELGQLAESFNTMSQALEERSQALEQSRLALQQEEQRYRELAAHLEEQVNLRTAELVASRDVAEAASRAKSLFLANMSHEIRTPLNAILGLTYLLRSEATAAQGERLAKIDGAGKHLLSVLNDILDFSKIEAGKLQLEHSDFHLSVVLDHVRSMIAESARAKGLEVVIDPNTVPFWLRGDVMRLRQGLLNYASNALKFTERGEITLSAVLLEEQGEELLIRFEVRDSGCGISPEQLTRLFQPFTQADASTTRQHGGTGLGLTITRRLAQQMGGDAGVESQLGSGSCFWFTARLQRGQAGGLPPEVATNDAAQRLQTRAQRARLLLAEDNAVNREVALDLLRGVGLAVDVAEDGIEALELARQHHYDLVLMDLQMPNLDGLGATHAIRELKGWAEIPILAMTANAFDEDREAARLAGMSDHVAKPVDPEQLFASLLKWLPAVSGEEGAEERCEGASDESDGASDESEGVTERSVLAALAELTGLLDLEAGLKVVRGNTTSYRRVLCLFAEGHLEDVERLTAFIERGELAAAQQLAHALKGAAGNVGATAIYALASTLDSALKQQDQVAAVAALAPLAEQLPPLLVALKQRLHEEVRAEVIASDEWSTEQQQVLAELVIRLEVADISARHLLTEQRQLLETALGSECYGELERLIRRFDYPGAVAMVQSVLAIGKVCA